MALHDVPLGLLQEIEPRITRDVHKVLNAESSVKSRMSHGGTAPKNVRREANKWLKVLTQKKD
jgi:argininosuccinate lyase